jgi:hypothetical protein
MRGGLHHPRSPGRRIGPGTASGEIHSAEIELRRRVILVGRRLHPFECQCIVLTHPAAEPRERGEPVLRLGVALLGEPAQRRHRGGVGAAANGLVDSGGDARVLGGARRHGDARTLQRRRHQDGENPRSGACRTGY